MGLYLDCAVQRLKTSVIHINFINDTYRREPEAATRQLLKPATGRARRLGVYNLVARKAHHDNVVGVMQHLCPQYPPDLIRRVYWRVVTNNYAV